MPSQRSAFQKCAKALRPRVTFARDCQLELALFNKLLHSPLSSSKAASDARCTQSTRLASFASQMCLAHGLKALALQPSTYRLFAMLA